MANSRQQSFGAIVGVGAVVAGLAAAQFIAAFNTHLHNPIVSVGNRVIDHVPGSVKEFAIRLFGVHDKVALVSGIFLIVFLLAILIGRSFLAGKRALAFSLLAVLTLSAVVSSALDAGASIISPLPSLVAGATAFLVLSWFGLRSMAGSGQGGELTRRDLLKGLAVIGGGVVIAGGVSRLLRERVTSQLARLNVHLPRPSRALPPPPIDPASTTPGLSKLFTPNKEFYRIDTALVAPSIAIDSWRLRIDGMVSNTREFTYAELLRRPLFELDDTIACVSNEVGGDLVGNARWLGVRLDDLVKEAAPTSQADQVLGHSDDGFTAGFPIAVLDGRDAMVAVGMNDEPLPVEHGFPARIIVPGLYGYVSATKWLTRIELTRFDKAEGYWIPRGWSVLAPIKTQSRIDTPLDGSRVKSGPVAIAGVAWAPTRGITRVEVRIDGDPWRAATLGPELAKTTWRQWWINWAAVPGDHKIMVRATDGTGAVQSGRHVSVVPNGAEGWHTIKVSVS